MALNWSLNELYADFHSPEFKNDFITFEQEIEKLNATANELSDLSTLETFIRISEKLHSLATKLANFANLTFTTNTSSEDALNAINKFDSLYTGISLAQSKLAKFLNTIPDVDAFIQSSEYLKEFTFILNEFKQSASHMLSEKEEILAAKLSITGSNAWSTLQSKLVSTLKCELTLDGETKELPMTVVRNLAHDASADVRKTAYDAELTAYKKVAEAVAMSLNSIKGEVITMSKIRGFESPLFMTLENSRMSKKTLDAMMTAIKKSIPNFEKYLKTKAQLLGHDNGLPFYDMFAPIGTASKKFTYEEGSRFVVDNFRDFSDKLADMAENAIQKNWIDVEPYEGKVSGAFCAPLHSIGEFRVLLNYTGNLGDVITMAHELGHGYHAICTNAESPLNIGYPMPLAETASTFCETIVNNATLKIATPEESITILENTLQDATQVICDIYSRYLFETAVFNAREDHPLSVEELNTLMTDAQKQAYGSGLDHSNLHPFMWLIKPHYYSAGLNFYNFPYAFGLLFAKGLYAKYLENPVFFKEKYDLLLAASGKLSIVDVCKIMNIDVESEVFWDASLQIIQADIEKFIQLTGGNK